MTKEIKETKAQTKVAKAITKETKPEPEEKTEELTAFQIKDRKQRTVFVGNLPVSATQKSIKKHFQEIGTVEKVWFRSICTEQESKKSERAKILTKEYGSAKDNKNGYVLYAEK